MNVGGKHGRESQWSETLRKGDHGGRSDASDLPCVAPIQRVVGIVAWLWYEHLAMCTFDEMMRPNIGHDLRAGQNLSVQFIFDLSTLLDEISDGTLMKHWTTYRVGHIFCLHGGDFGT